MSAERPAEPQPAPDAGGVSPSPPASAARQPIEGYAAAVTELEAILTELEDDQIDVDHLAERVRRAAELIRFCRERIGATRVEVERIVADLEQLDEPPPA